MAAKWTDKSLNNTLTDDHQLMRLDLSQLPANQNRRATLQALRQWLSPTRQQTVIVDPGSAHVDADGSSLRPYGTITAALTSITDALPTKRYTISVLAGTTTENVSCKPNISIIGIPKTTKITGDITTTATSLGAMVLAGLVITGDVTLTNSGSTACDLSLVDLEITGTLNMTGRGAGSDRCNLTCLKVTGNTSLAGMIFNSYCVRHIGSLTITESGTTLDSLDYNFRYNTYNGSIESLLSVITSGADKGRAVFVSSHIGVSTTSIEGNNTEAAFDFVSYPDGTIVTVGSPTIELPNTDIIIPSENAGARDLTGFPNRTDSDYSITGSVFTLEPSVSGGSFDAWTGGVRHTYDAALTVTIPDDVGDEGQEHYIYLDTDGVMKITQTEWDVTGTAAPIAIVFRDGADFAKQDERHAHDRDRRWHNFEHHNRGAIIESGFGLTADNTSFTLGSGIMWDEDLDHPLIASTSATLWRRKTTLDGMRMVRGSARLAALEGGVLAYDLNGVMTPIDNNRYAVNWVYTCADDVESTYVVIGQAQYTNLAAAQAATAPTIYLSTAEWKLAYKTIWQNASGTATYIEATDFRRTVTGPPVLATFTDHEAMTNRDKPSQHPAKAIDDDVIVYITDDVVAGSVAITGGPDRRIQYADLDLSGPSPVGSPVPGPFVLEFTSVTELTAPSIITLKLETTDDGITYVFPADTRVIGDHPEEAGEHELQFERNTTGVLMAFLFSTPVVP